MPQVLGQFRRTPATMQPLMYGGSLNLTHYGNGYESS